MVQTIRNQIKAYKVQIEKNSGITIKDDSSLVTWLPRHAAWQYTRFRSMAIHAIPQATRFNINSDTRRSDTCLTNARFYSLERQFACRRPGALVNKLETAWLEGIWLGRDSETDEHLIGTPNGTVRSRPLKRRVERRRWVINLLNAMIWDPWNPTPVTRGRPLKVRSDREPILMGPIPRVHFTPPDDPDTLTTAAVPIQETTPGTTATHFAVERTRVRLPEAEAE